VTKTNMFVWKIIPLILLAIYLAFHVRYALLVAVVLSSVAELVKYFKTKNIYKYLVPGLLFMLLGGSILLGGRDFILKPFTIVMLLFVLICEFKFQMRQH